MKTPVLQENHSEKSSGVQVEMPLDLGMRIEAGNTMRTLIHGKDGLQRIDPNIPAPATQGLGDAEAAVWDRSPGVRERAVFHAKNRDGIPK
ncbi:MAG: hypothetical protein VB051_04160 [Candidatus Pelethousia sp.]|nr:hypothetical protein [Candidatus Pelethousia sp.]